MHINSSLSSLIGGVSQQPELLRLPSHLKAQENGLSTAAKGLSKRPPSVHRGIISGFTGAGFHTTIDYGPRGIFHMNVDNSTGAIKMTTETGAAVPLYSVTGAPLGSAGYLVTATPETSLRVVKEADTAFIINTDVVAQEALTGASTSIWMGLVWVKAGNYGRTYSVTVPGVGTFSYATPSGSVSTDITATQTNVIASNLGSQMAAAGIPVSVAGSVISLYAGGYAGMTADDGSGGTAMSVVYKSIRTVADLPSRNAYPGFTVKVDGGDATPAGDHYLTFDPTDNVYKEARSPVEAWSTPNSGTMPLMMVPYADGFQIKAITWSGRIVGDAATNPPPSFIGKRITDLCFYQDRMGLISGEGFDLSEVGEYFNFMRTTVIDLLDSDPISGSVSHPKVSTLRHAVTFNKRLLFFSDKAQFELSSGEFLTPKTVATRQLTEFECSSVVRPTGIGTSLYFPVDKGNFSSFYNFFVSGTDSLEDAVDISGHVPEYVPKNVTQMATSPVNNIVVALSKDDPSTLYVYQFYQDGAQRLQSAWHKWPYHAGSTILSISVVGTRLIMLVKRNTSAGPVVTCEAITLNAAPLDYRMDRKVTIAPAGLTLYGTGLMTQTHFTLPYKAGVGSYYAVVSQGSPTVKAGSVYRLTTDPEGTAAAMLGNLSGCTLEVGLGYAFRGTLGRFMVREQAGQGSAGISRGRTQVGRMWVNYADAATFSIEVAVEGREVKTYKSTGRLLGTSTARVGEREVGDGRFGCPVLAENNKVSVTLVNDTPLPSSFLSVDWEGYHVSRGQHV